MSGQQVILLMNEDFGPCTVTYKTTQLLFVSVVQQNQEGQGLLIIEVSRSHSVILHTR
jgi:hypothetical protein